MAATINIKDPAERNKLIAAAVLGLVALIALYLAFGRGMFGGSTAATTATTPTPRPTASPADRTVDNRMVSREEQDFVYQTTPIDYSPGASYAPDAGRNIFAFYEPPPPTPFVPPSPSPPVIVPPSPVPTPPILLSFVNPQTVFAGSKGFRLEINGDKFTPDTRIYFNQSPMPTVFVNAQRMFTDVPANLIAQEGPKQIIIQTPDGKTYSNQVIFSVQPPPKPNVTYIGMIARKRANNDTAYFTEPGNDKPYGKRLNDIVGGRFRLINITSENVEFEDTQLGFKHRVPLNRTPPTTAGNVPSPYPTFNPAMPGGNIPGIPDNIPRYVPPNQPANARPQRPPEKKEDVDDLEDGVEKKP
ncbi:MAG: hypothetical protein IPM50_10140 [Acidobacteriota bacterium]|nr:MAG: hypothetical protein IPM50_10140 [Acidobacteriota bacterium]